MATILKCKMCGGDLKIQPGDSVAECLYCGSKQTLPNNLTDEKRANLYERANNYRLENDFDKAYAIYEQIVSEDNTDAEAHWSLVLCKYGIEYVEDPGTKKRVPTVNRAQYTSIYDNEDYKQAIKYGTPEQIELYKAEAEAFDKIQQDILSISSKEDPFDVFICYKETDSKGKRTQDSVYAYNIYQDLTDKGYKVFFSRVTLADKAGEAYEPYIFAALNSAQIMIVVATNPKNLEAVWVKNEWSRYLNLLQKDKSKKIITVYKGFNPSKLPNALQYLQAMDMNNLGFMQDLERGVKKVIDNNAASNAAPVAPVPDKKSIKDKLDKKIIIGIAAAAVVIMGIITMAVISRGNKNAADVTPVTEKTNEEQLQNEEEAEEPIDWKTEKGSLYLSNDELTTLAHQYYENGHMAFPTSINIEGPDGDVVTIRLSNSEDTLAVYTVNRTTGKGEDSDGIAFDWAKLIEAAGIGNSLLSLSDDEIVNKLYEASELLTFLFYGENTTKYCDVNDVIHGNYGNTGEWDYRLVTIDGVNTYNDLIEYTENYYTPVKAKQLVEMGLWREENGHLYHGDFEGSADRDDSYEISIKNKDDGYEITIFSEFWYSEGGIINLTYNNGKWQLDDELVCHDYIGNKIPITVKSRDTESYDSNGNSVLNYQYENSQLGFRIGIPEEYTSEVSYVEYASGVSFYSDTCKKGGNGGWLFSIIKCRTDEIEDETFDLDNSKTLYVSGNTAFVIGGPTDVQYTKATEDLYRKLYSYYDAIADSFEYFGDSGSSEYFLDYSSDRLITDYELSHLSQDEKRIAKNEIYAKHGRMFRDEELQAYFNSKSWYNGYIKPDDFNENVLNEIEKQNVIALSK